MTTSDLSPAGRYWVGSPARRYLVRDEDLNLVQETLPPQAAPDRVVQPQAGVGGLQVPVRIESAIPAGRRTARQHALFVMDVNSHGDLREIAWYRPFNLVPTVRNGFQHVLARTGVQPTATLFRRIDNFGLCFDLAAVFDYFDRLYRLSPHHNREVAYLKAFASLVLDQGLLHPAQRAHLSSEDEGELVQWLGVQFPEAVKLFRYVSEQFYNTARDGLTNNGGQPERWEEYLEWTGIARLLYHYKEFLPEHTALATEEIYEPRITLADYLFIAHRAFDSFTAHQYPRAAPQPPPRLSTGEIARSVWDDDEQPTSARKAATFPQSRERNVLRKPVLDRTNSVHSVHSAESSQSLNSAQSAPRRSGSIFRHMSLRRG